MKRNFACSRKTAACGFCIIEDDKISYANLAAEKVTGYSRDELLNMKFWELIHPEHRQFYEKDATGGSISADKQEIKILTKDNQVKWVILSCGGDVINGKQVVLVTFYDITERKIAEGSSQQLYRVQKMEIVESLLVAWLTNNNQLTVIQAYLTLCQR